jgi:uncharacterized membrane protein YdbT with pleckstrin-like domain
MQINQKTDQFLHHKLPIDENEKILAVYRHHWFAYVSNWILGVFIVIVVMAIAIVFTSIGGSQTALATHRAAIIAVAGCFSVLVLLGTFIPVYLRSQEELVLTEEALLQVLQPSLFASKIDQLNLQHITDVSVRQDFFGTILGYGHLTIETPGEQDNYEFIMLPKPQQSAREISQAHENYTAAVQGGRMPSTLGTPQQPTVPAIDPQQYQQFLQYQEMVAQQRATQQNQPSQPEQVPQSNQPNNEQIPTDSNPQS